MTFSNKPLMGGQPLGELPDVIDVFLCHNGSDKEWARELAERIESETFDGTPQGRPLRVFFDQWDIDVGENFVQRINDGLNQSRFVAVIISPEFLSAPWTAFEWTHIVAQDPANTQARLIPLFRREYSLDGKETCDLPAPFRALNWIDFRRESEFKRSYQRFIRKIRGLPPERGRRRPALAKSDSRALPAPEPHNSAAPDRVNDLVLSNLLPVAEYPQTIWSAPTDARTPRDVWSKLDNSPPFILREQRLYAFADLAHQLSPFRSITSRNGIKGEPIATWRSDSVRWLWFIDLLNRSLRDHLGKMGIKAEKSNRFFFKGAADGTSRKHRNAQDDEREVAAKKVNLSDNSSFWVHHGAELRFLTLGEGVFLCMEPCYVFTSDGRSPLTGPRVTPLSMKWGGKERNASILRHVIFWARTLGRGKARIEIGTGGKPIVIHGIPALSRTSFGIEFDHIGLKTLIAQVEDELGEVAKSLEGASFGSKETTSPSTDYDEPTAQ